MRSLTRSGGFRTGRGSDAYVGLGSNLGQREAHLAHGLRGLRALPRSTWGACSRIYETEPLGPPPQGRYLNCVARLRTQLSPRELLQALQAIEATAGRTRSGERNRPRTLDLDLLLFGDRHIEEKGLRVPHPRLAERSFVLEPLSELAPRLKPPTLAATVEELARSVRDPEAVRPWQGTFPGSVLSDSGSDPSTE